MKKYRLTLLCLTEKKYLQFLIVFELTIIFSIATLFSGIFFDRCQIVNTFSDLLYNKGDRAFISADRWDDYEEYKKSMQNRNKDVLSQLSNVKEVVQIGYYSKGANEVYTIPDYIFDGMNKEVAEGQVNDSFVLPNPSGIHANSEVTFEGAKIKIDAVLKNEGYYFDFSTYKADAGMEQFYQQFNGEQTANLIFIKESYAEKLKLRTQALENCFITYNENITDEELSANRSILQKYAITDSYESMLSRTMKYTWKELNRFFPIVIFLFVMCLIGVFGSVCIIDESNSDMYRACTLMGATPRQKHGIALAQFLALIGIAILCMAGGFYVMNLFDLFEPLGLVLNTKCFIITGVTVLFVLGVFEFVYWIRLRKRSKN